MKKAAICGFLFESLDNRGEMLNVYKEGLEPSTVSTEEKSTTIVQFACKHH
jgi:hypothetical protein